MEQDCLRLRRNTGKYNRNKLMKVLVVNSFRGEFKFVTFAVFTHLNKYYLVEAMLFNKKCFQIFVSLKKM